MNGVDRLANVGAEYVSLSFAIPLAILAMMVIYLPVMVGIASMLEKMVPWKVRGSKLYGYTLATLMGGGGIAFMVVAVNFLKL